MTPRRKRSSCEDVNARNVTQQKMNTAETELSAACFGSSLYLVPLDLHLSAPLRQSRHSSNAVYVLTETFEIGPGSQPFFAHCLPRQHVGRTTRWAWTGATSMRANANLITCQSLSVSAAAINTPPSHEQGLTCLESNKMACGLAARIIAI